MRNPSLPIKYNYKLEQQVSRLCDRAGGATKHISYAFVYSQAINYSSFVGIIVGHGITLLCT